MGVGGHCRDCLSWGQVGPRLPEKLCGSVKQNETGQVWLEGCSTPPTCTVPIDVMVKQREVCQGPHPLVRGLDVCSDAPPYFLNNPKFITVKFSSNMTRKCQCMSYLMIQIF